MERPDLTLAIECCTWKSGHVFRLLPNGTGRFPPGVRHWRYLSEEDWVSVPEDMLFEKEELTPALKLAKEEFKQHKLAADKRRNDYRPTPKRRKRKAAPENGPAMYEAPNSQPEEGYV